MSRRQQDFDTVWHALTKQGRRSMDHDGYCRYRTKHGDRCAFGHLITDAEYDPRWENASVLWLKIEGNLPDRFVDDADFYAHLQDCHDLASEFKFTADFRRRMRALARLFNLTVPKD